MGSEFVRLLRPLEAMMRWFNATGVRTAIIGGVSEVRRLARRPAVVLACGAASVALEDDVAREIHVRVN